MNYAIVAGVIAAVLLLVRHLMAKARVDQIINALPKDDKAKQIFDSEVDRVKQEIQNADIAYSNAKRNAQQSDRKGK